MVPIRHPFVAPLLWILLACALGGRGLCQAEEVEAVPNPSIRGPRHSLPEIEEVHRESYADFQKLVAERQWSRAFRAIAAQMETPPQGLMPMDSGFVHGWSEQLWRDLLTLGPDARRAFRLFYDAKAKKLLEAARREADPADRRAKTVQVFDAYFLSTVGDDAALDLARDSLDHGAPAKAVTYLRAIVDHHPDTDLDPGLVWALLCTGLARAQDAEGLTKARDYASERHGAERLELPGHDGTVAAYLNSLSVATPAGGQELLPDLRLLATPDPVSDWTHTIPKGLSLRRTPGETRAIPTTQVFGALLLVNNCQQHFAIRLTDGSLVWRDGQPRPDLAGRASQQIVLRDTVAFFVDPATEALVARDAATGKVAWRTNKIAAWKTLKVRSAPAFDALRGYLIGQADESQQSLAIAFEPTDGRILWRVDIGIPGRASEDGSGGWFPENASAAGQPQVLVAGGVVLAHADGGALIALDPTDGHIAWAYRHTLSGGASSGAAAGLTQVDGDVLFRATHDRSIKAIDPALRRLVFEKRVESSARFVGCDQDHFYFLGKEMLAIARADRRLVWARRVSLPPGRIDIVPTRSYVYLASRRGLHELNRTNGDDVRIFRPGESLPSGASLCMLGDRLIVAGDDRIVALRLVGPDSETR